MWLADSKFMPTGQRHDFAGAIAEVTQQQPWLDGLKKKYSGTDGYWPTLLGSYFYPDVPELKRSQQAAIEAKKNPATADHPRRRLTRRGEIRAAH